MASRILANLLVAGGAMLFKAATTAYKQAIISTWHGFFVDCCLAALEPEPPPPRPNVLSPPLPCSNTMQMRQRAV
jgi:hypothetical protein